MPGIFAVWQHCHVIDLSLTACAVKRPMDAQPSLVVMISRGLGICPNKPYEEIHAEAEISKTSIPGQECPACEVVRFLICYALYMDKHFVI